jgi:hypothetical protein
MAENPRIQVVRTKTERRYNPHLLLLRCADHYIAKAKQKKDGCYYEWLATILMSALTIEAIGNSYGERLIDEWKDFESASPIAKLRLVATRCGVKPDFGRQPWQTARLLVHFRNLIAHAKPKHLEIKKDCTLIDYGQVFSANLESDLEKMITPEFASKSYDAVEEIRKAFNKNLKAPERYDLTYDGHVSQASVVAEG